MPKRKGAATKTIADELYPGFSARSERGRKARAKGVAYERQIASRLRRVYPKARRLFGQAREGSECPDIGGTPWWIECTDSEASIASKLRQATAAAKASSSPEYRNRPVVVVTHRPKQPTIVSMEFEAWLDLMGDLRFSAGTLGDKDVTNAQ
jgi:hypothetical protein